MAIHKMDNERRKFVKTAGKAAAVAPAVSLLLTGGVIPGTADAAIYSEPDSVPPLPNPEPAPDPLVPEPPLVYPRKK